MNVIFIRVKLFVPLVTTVTQIIVCNVSAVMKNKVNFALSHKMSVVS